MRGTALARVFTVGLVALLLALAPVSAGSALEADLQVRGPLTLGASNTWEAADPFIDLTTDGSVPASVFALTSSRATVYVRTMSTDFLEPGLVSVSSTPRSDEQTYQLTDVTLREVTLGPQAHIMLDGDGRGFMAAAESNDGSLYAARHVYGSADPEFAGPVEDEARPYFVDAEDQIVLESTATTLEGTGTVRLSLWDTRLLLDAAEGEVEIVTGSQPDPLKPDAGPYRSEHRRIAWIDLHGAHVRVDWAGPARLAAAGPVIGATDVVADDAAGRLMVHDLALHPAAERVVLQGTLSITPRVLPDTPTAPIGLTVLAYTHTGATVTGDVDAVTLSGAIVQSTRDGAPLIAAGAGIGLLGLAAAAWRWGPLALAALYSRLDQGAILDNPVRAQIYEIVRQNPGINARGVHRLADASWGTVAHHLSKLCASGYLVARRYGRSKCFYENHGKWDDAQDGLAILARPKTRLIADTVTSVPGRDQGQIIARTGLSQSTVSYYLLKLEKAGLATKEREGVGWVYHPTPRLRNILSRTAALASASQEAT